VVTYSYSQRYNVVSGCEYTELGGDMQLIGVLDIVIHGCKYTIFVVTYSQISSAIMSCIYFKK
jgi:hypothetical protein